MQTSRYIYNEYVCGPILHSYIDPQPHLRWLLPTIFCLLITAFYSLQEPFLTTEGGDKISSSAGIARYSESYYPLRTVLSDLSLPSHIASPATLTDLPSSSCNSSTSLSLPINAVAASSQGASTLTPAGLELQINELLDLATSIEAAAAAWIEPTCQAASAEDRTTAKAALEGHLATLNSRITSPAALLGDGLTLADINVACSLVGLYQAVLGVDVQAQHPNVGAWLQGIVAQPHFKAILGKSIILLYNFHCSRSVV